MKLSDETRAGVPHNGAAGVSEEGARGGWIEVLTRFVEEAFASASGLIEVKADRMRLTLRRTIVKVVLATSAAICASFWLGAAALATVRGLCGWITALAGGRAWLGELGGGLLALLLAAGGCALFLKSSERRERVRLEAKYERIRKTSLPKD